MEDIEQLLAMPDETLQAEERTAEAWLAELSAPAARPGLGWVLLVFAGGLFLGWLLIGWWLWPVQWTNASPWDLQPRYQEKFVSLVAAQYWQSSDVEQVREALAGWDDKALARLLTAMEGEAPTVEVGQQLAALREALALSEGDFSLWALLLRQRAILWSVTLVLAVLCVAIGVVAARRVLRAVAVRGSGRALPPVVTEDDVPAELEEQEQAVLLEAFAEAEAELEDLVEPGKEGMDQAWAENTAEIQGEDATQVAELTQAAEPAKASEAAQAKSGEKAKGAGKAEQGGAESMMEMLARGEKSEGGLDLTDIEGDEGLLADLFTAETNDARFEVIRPMLEEVDLFSLVEETSRVLSQLVALHRDPAVVADGARSWS